MNDSKQPYVLLKSLPVGAYFKNWYGDKVGPLTFQKKENHCIAVFDNLVPIVGTFYELAPYSKVILVEKPVENK